MLTNEEMLQITKAVECGLQQFRGELNEFREEVRGRFDEQDRRLEEHDRRFDEHDRKLDEHTRILNEHTRILNEHTRTLDEHTRVLDEHMRVLNEHTRILDEHTQRLDEHSIMLKELSNKFDRNEMILKEVLETVNMSYRKFEMAAEKVEWCDMRIRVLGDVVSEHSQQLARVEEKIAKYEAGSQKDGDSVSPGKDKTGR